MIRAAQAMTLGSAPLGPSKSLLTPRKTEAWSCARLCASSIISLPRLLVEASATTLIEINPFLIQPYGNRAPLRSN
jgi:hypothetical protein